LRAPEIAMFGKSSAKAAGVRAYDQAKEATRRASFLNTASQLPQSDPDRRDLAMLFRVCRAMALGIGAEIGKTQPEIDAEIAALCDADIARLKKASHSAVQDFARESHKITKAFLATVDPNAFSTSPQPTKH
jgi:hypothetical protein